MTNQQISMVIELQKLGMQKASDCYGVVTMRMRENPPEWVADLPFSPNEIRAEISPSGIIEWSKPAIPEVLLRRMVRR